MKRVLVGLSAVVAAMGLTADTGAAQSDFGLLLHMTPATYFGCGDPLVQDEDMTCETVNEVGNALVQDNFAWVFVYGYNLAPGWPTAAGSRDLGAVAFGINYSETVLVGGWTLCTGGAEIPEDDFIGTWPASGTGNAVTWSGGGYDSPSVDKMARIGFLSIGSGSIGRITLQEPPQTAQQGIFEIQLTSGVPNPQAFDVPRAAWSSVVVSSADNPDDARNACLEAVPTRETSWGELKSLF